jgi:hypothetical protein
MERTRRGPPAVAFGLESCARREGRHATRREVHEKTVALSRLTNIQAHLPVVNASEWTLPESAKGRAIRPTPGFRFYLRSVAMRAVRPRVSSINVGATINVEATTHLDGIGRLF